MPEVVPLAPEYRYFTVDLLSNEILTEIPFREVTWERAIKGAGSFAGKIPVIKDTSNLNLYETTLPGKTGLYVVRNNECVWGGIIWARQHDVVSHNLSVSASEFSSYLYHRKIWKTWNHQFGATVTISPDAETVSRTNYAKNPQGMSDFDGWGLRGFGAGTGSRSYGLSSTPLDMPAGTTYFARKTWSSTSNAANLDGTGFQVGDAVPAVPGEIWTISGWVRPNRADKNMGAKAILRSGTTVVSTLDAVTKTYISVPDQWIFLQLTFSVPAGVDNFLPILDAYSAGSAAGWIGGSTLDATGVLVEKGDTAGTFMDGTSPAVGRKRFGFTGVANQSTSVEYTLTRKGGKVALDYGSDVTILPGSSVQIEFYDPKDFQYNGFYRVSGEPAPTGSIFEVVGGQSLVDLASVEIRNNLAYVTTAAKHGFNTGDLITVDSDYGFPFLGTFEVTSPGGSFTDLFTFPVTHADIPRTVSIGTATRPVPFGVYRDATVTVRTDTYDYIRNLIRATFSDFVGTDFPNVYIEPGISYGMDIVNAGITGGLATIITDEPHNLSLGQAVQIKNLSPLFDGEYEVTHIPDENTFRYARSGEVAPTSIFPRQAVIETVSLIDNVATIQTTTPHNYLVGQVVDVFVGYDYDTMNGSWTIDTVPEGSTFTYKVLSTANIPSTTFTKATAASGTQTVSVVASQADKTTATLTTKEAHNFKVGDTIEVNDVNRNVRIIEKSYDAPNTRATITTAVPHGFKAETSDMSGGSKMWTNLVENPNIYPALAGWSGGSGVGGAGALTRVQVNSDWYARYTFSTAPTGFGASIAYYTLGKVAVTPGLQYFGRIHGRTSWSGANTRAVLSWYNSAGTLLSTSPGQTVAWNAPADDAEAIKQGQMYSNGPRHVTAVAPANAAYAQITYEFVSGTLPTAGGYMQVNGAEVIQTANPVPLYVAGMVAAYELGGTSSGPGYYIVWDGAVNASTSSRYWASQVTISGVRDSAHFIRKQSPAGDPSKIILTTDRGHNFSVGDFMDFGPIRDEYEVITKRLTSNIATITTKVNHNIRADSTVFRVDGLLDTYNVNSKMLSNNKATLTTTAPHNMKVNDEVTVTGIVDTSAVVSKTAEKGIATLTMAVPHNFAETEEITISGVGAPFDGKFTVLSYTDTRVLYEIESENLILPAKSAGLVRGTNSVFNGTFPIVSVTSTSFTYQRSGEDVSATSGTGIATAPSVLNGAWPIQSVTANSISYAVTGNNMPLVTIPPADEEGEATPVASSYSIFGYQRGVLAVTRNTVTVSTASLNGPGPTQVVVPTDIDVIGSTYSDFNGPGTISSVTSDTFRFTMYLTSNVLETAVDDLAVASNGYLYNGRYTITAVDYDARTVTYTRPWPEVIPPAAVQSFGDATVRPVAIVSTFGPYPGNADMDFKFSTQKYSGINIEPIAYRGHELVSVGQALDAYSDSIDGFEYRIDCDYDAETNSFTRTFVLIPINFPDPPAPGDVSPLSRFGADKLVFEYPGGSITAMQIDESAEDSATRFFAVGENNLGADAGPPMSIASADDLLAGTNGEDDYRRWPLLDEDEKIDDIDDEDVLYTYAQRYLAENRPPDAKLSISVNGSIAPIVGTYSPGDWCSLIVDDEFVKMRLASDLEPRDDVIVRKIDSFKVTVPDGTTFPEKVSLVLVPEWEVDKRGKSSV